MAHYAYTGIIQFLAAGPAQHGHVCMLMEERPIIRPMRNCLAGCSANYSLSEGDIHLGPTDFYALLLKLTSFCCQSELPQLSKQYHHVGRSILFGIRCLAAYAT